MPPLRSRREDIPPLVNHFVRKHAARAGKRIEAVDPEVMAMLTKSDWPGNVRELENTVERAVVLTSGTVIDRAAVRLLGVVAAHASGLPSPNLRQHIEWVERETLRRALEAAGGVKKEAGETMGISQRALSYYLGKHRVES